MIYSIVYFLSLALLFPPRVQRLPAVINFYRVAKARAQHTLSQCTMTPFLTPLLSLLPSRHTHTHAHTQGRRDQRCICRSHFYQFPTNGFPHWHAQRNIRLQNNTVREEEQAHICFSMFVLLCKRGSLACVCLVSEGGPSTVYVWHYGLVMKVLVEGSGPSGLPLKMDTVSSRSGRQGKESKCLRSSNIVEIWQSAW